MWEPGDRSGKNEKEEKMLERISRQMERGKQNTFKVKETQKPRSNHNLIPNKSIVLAFDFISYERDRERALDDGKKFNDSKNKYYRRGLVKEVYRANGIDFVKIEFDHRKGFISEGHLLSDIRITQ